MITPLPPETLAAFGGDELPARIFFDKYAARDEHNRLTCRVHRANARVMVVAACITRQLPALERFSALVGAPADVPGVPLEFQVQVQPPDNRPGFRIRQSLLSVTRERLDAGLLAPPLAATPSGSRRP